MIYHRLRFRAIIHEMCKSKHRGYLLTAVQKQSFYVLYSMLFTRWTSKNFTELYYDDEGVVTFQCSLHLCQQSSAIFKQAHIFPPGNSWSGNRGSTAVKVLCYKSEGRWFDPSWCQWIFHRHKILLIALWPWGRQSLYQK